MKRADVKELHYITHIDNLRSISQYGILCHRKAKKVLCQSIADPEIQKRREKVVIPGGKRKLHDYANLYFNARNPMMYKRKDMHEELAVLRIDSAILDESEVVISDGNAASDYVKFHTSPEGLKYLDKNLIFAEYWTDPNRITAYRRRFAICAEVLVRDSVPPKFIMGVCVCTQKTYQKVVELLKELSLAHKISIKPKLFFREV